MYRLLAGDGACSERRRQLTHPAYAKPELLAQGPNEVRSWDITKAQGSQHPNRFKGKRPMPAVLPTAA